MTQSEKLLSKLGKVQPKGSGRWVARCPAHGDKSPSLAISETNDDRILIHCFAGCSTLEVLQSLGLTFDDLFSTKQESEGFQKRVYRPFSIAQIIAAFQLELLVAVQILGGFSRGDLLPDGTLELAGRTSENIARLAGELTR
jgi:DNA primase